ncbi:hypothetical protein BKA81DRAFT_152892 [Phyllosticta paracitricarpa]
MPHSAPLHPPSPVPFAVAQHLHLTSTPPSLAPLVFGPSVLLASQPVRDSRSIRPPTIRTDHLATSLCCPSPRSPRLKGSIQYIHSFSLLSLSSPAQLSPSTYATCLPA